MHRIRGVRCLLFASVSATSVWRSRDGGDRGGSFILIVACDVCFLCHLCAPLFLKATLGQQPPQALLCVRGGVACEQCTAVIACPCWIKLQALQEALCGVVHERSDRHASPALGPTSSSWLGTWQLGLGPACDSGCTALTIGTYCSRGQPRLFYPPIGQRSWRKNLGICEDGRRRRAPPNILQLGTWRQRAWRSSQSRSNHAARGPWHANGGGIGC